MNRIRTIAAALVLGTVALGAQAGEVTGYEIHTQGGYHAMTAPAGSAARTVGTGSVDTVTIAPVNGEVAAGDLGLRPLQRGTSEPLRMSGGRIESQFAIGA